MWVTKKKYIDTDSDLELDFNNHKNNTIHLLALGEGSVVKVAEKVVDYAFEDAFEKAKKIGVWNVLKFVCWFINPILFWTVISHFLLLIEIQFIHIVFILIWLIILTIITMALVASMIRIDYILRKILPEKVKSFLSNPTVPSSRKDLQKIMNEQAIHIATQRSYIASAFIGSQRLPEGKKAKIVWLIIYLISLVISIFASMILYLIIQGFTPHLITIPYIGVYIQMASNLLSDFNVLILLFLLTLIPSIFFVKETVKQNWKSIMFPALVGSSIVGLDTALIKIFPFITIGVVALTRRNQFLKLEPFSETLSFKDILSKAIMNIGIPGTPVVLVWRLRRSKEDEIIQAIKSVYKSKVFGKHFFVKAMPLA